MKPSEKGRLHKAGDLFSSGGGPSRSLNDDMKAPHRSKPASSVATRMLWVAFWGAPLVVSLLGLTTCPSALIFDSPCPGCGLTRSVKALLSGDWETALQLHPLGPFVAPALALLFGGYAAHYLRTGSSSMPRRVQGLLLVIVASLFVVWVARHAGAFGGPVPVGLNGT